MQLQASDLTPEKGRDALHDHLVDRAMRARVQCGFYMDAEAIIAMLTDGEVVRYPTNIAFDDAFLESGEFAFPRANEPGSPFAFTLYIHPWFRQQGDILPLLIAYHIPTINYGDIVTHEEAELFGATLLGLDVDTYYNALCELVDSIPA